MSAKYRGYSLEQVSGVIDHSVLKPESTASDISVGAEIAIRNSVASLCIRPSDVHQARELLAGSTVELSTVIGFPHGTTTTATKVFESVEAVKAGAVELDMVLNVGWLVSGRVDEVTADIAAVVSAAKSENPKVMVKVIFETALLNEDQIVAACQASETAGADYVKTSTGFAATGATAAHIRLMRETVGQRLGVKASGGVRTLDAIIDMIDAGATRVGSSSTDAVLAEFREKAL
jgi:deoxyribose-phosphate aldolase